MTFVTVPLCESCAHLRPADTAELGVVCDAFPDGIPDSIYRDGGDHRQPVDGDHGVQWKLSSERGAKARLDAYNEDHAPA